MADWLTLRHLPRWWFNQLIWFLSITHSPICNLNSLILSTDRHPLRWWHHMVHYTSSLWWIFSTILNTSRSTTNNLNRSPLVLLTLLQCNLSINTTLLMSMILMSSEDNSKLKSKEGISEDCLNQINFLGSLMIYNVIYLRPTKVTFP